jgi:hypothetical protein
MKQEIAIGGTHGKRPFHRPCSGALSSLHITPGVPLRSTPPCSSAALHCRLYSAAPPALFSILPATISAPEARGNKAPRRAQRNSGIECRRRAGVKPGVQRSGTPGKNYQQYAEPLTGVTESEVPEPALD